MKYALAALILVTLMQQTANAQFNTDGLLDFTRQRIAPPSSVPTPEVRSTTSALGPVPLPPVKYDHAYAGGQLIVTKWNDYDLIRLICDDSPRAIACSYRAYNTVTGKPLSCLIMLGPDAWNDDRAMRHEIAHCNGWPSDHPGAR